MTPSRGRALQRLLAIAGAVCLVLLPFYASPYAVTTCVRIIYFGFLALSVGFLIGQAGMVSLTQTAFFGMSGYTLGLLGKERGLPFPWADLAALAVVFGFALIFGLIAMRTEGIVFLMITLAFGQICWAFAQQNTSLLHGWAGIRGIRAPTLFGIDFKTTAHFYWASLAIFALGTAALGFLRESSFGLALNGIRENPRRMAALGYPVYALRVLAFLIAALYAGLGGLLAAYNTGIITPTTVQLSRTIWVLLAVILGGSTYFWGPLVGTVVAIGLDVFLSSVTERYNSVIGLVFVVAVIFFPRGLLSVADRWVGRPRAGAGSKTLHPVADPRNLH